jgi:hypothetical protein
LDEVAEVNCQYVTVSHRKDNNGSTYKEEDAIDDDDDNDDDSDNDNG